MRARLALCHCLYLGFLLLPIAAPAQEDDRSYLVALLEDNLSDAGRRVTITGFAGALSSVATIEQLTIADDEGSWITLRNLSLGWSRSALLSGEVLVTELSAGEIILERIPTAADSAVPATEGAAFALPELPVSVKIGRIAADRIVLGESILGEGVEGKAVASVSLVSGEGKIVLNLDRLDDGPEGHFALDIGYSNASGQLSVSLDAQEQADGIAVRLLSVPGAPSARLTIEGSGPLDDFAADIALVTDNQPRLTGRVKLAGDGRGKRDFVADISGDLAPVFWPEYRDLLGDNLALAATGSSLPDGRIDLSDFTLASGAVRAKGQLALAADGLPESFSMNLAIMGHEGAPLLLPLTSEVQTRIASARLNLGFDAAQSDAWTLAGLIIGLDRADFAAQSLNLSGGGNIARTGVTQRVSADLNFLGIGLTLADAALAKALGQTLSGKLVANWQQGGGQTDVTELSLAGDDYTLTASGAVQGLTSGFAFGGRVAGSWGDLSRLSDLTGLPLGGKAALSASGSASALGNAFDLRFSASGEDMRIGIAEIDNLLRGKSQVAGQVARTETGTVLRDIRVTAGELSGTLNGTLNSAGVSLTSDLVLPNLSALGPRYRGRLSATASYSGTLEAGTLSLTGTGDALGIGQAEVDRVLAGSTSLSVSLGVTQGSPVLQSLRLEGQALDLTAQATANGTINVSAQLENLGLILPEFPGPLTLAGVLQQFANGTNVDLALKGPAQVSGALSGTLAPSYTSANLSFTGQSLAGVANPFIKPRALSGQLVYDLRLSGPLSLISLSGKITLLNGRLADPDLSFGIASIAADVQISDGQTRITSSAQVTSGGSLEVTGQSSLSKPYQGELNIALQNVTLRQASLFDTAIDGTLAIKGSLAGGATVSGALDLARTELRIPSTGFSGSEPIPEIRHVSEPANVRATRDRAGLIETSGGQGASGNGGYLLDILIRAPNQIFLRGRGLDAELGGSLRLRGTTASVSPEGSFDLIRGRLDLVGRRLTLSQAQLLLQGEFIPRIDIVASIEDTDIISTIRISGPATDPELTFESSPALPDEEILAQLLFGERLQSLSAFQAAQLAIAVRTLAGKGGEGLVAKLRKGSGLDNLDITANETGQASLTAGKYLSERTYSEVTVDQTGKTQIDLNYDLAPHITLKGKLESDGNTGVGIYLEKNY